MSFQKTSAGIPVKAVILVGGKGTRLHPLTYFTAKAMVPVLNKPFIHHIINYLYHYDIKEIILAMGYKPDAIKNYFEKIDMPQDIKLSYSIEDKPLGTAGAFKNTAHHINKNDVIYVFNGDILTDINLSDMLQFHKNKKAKVTIALTPVEDPTQFGVVELDHNQQVIRFAEKPKKEDVTSNLINAGIYILESEILDCIPDKTPFMFEHDVFPQLVSQGEPVFGYPTKAYWLDMGTLEKYVQVNTDILSGKYKLTRNLAFTRQIEENNTIHPEAIIEGAVVIDKGCKIGKGTRIKGPCIIGTDCRIGDEAIVETSILWHKVEIGKRSYIKNCIITDNLTIKDNAKLENAALSIQANSQEIYSTNLKTI